MATDSAHSTAPPAARQLWQVPVFLLGVAAVAAVPLLRPYWKNDRAAVEWQLRAARSALEQSSPDLPQAVLRGQRVIDAADRFPDLAAAAHFVVGSACLKLADEPGADSARERQHAHEHLEQAKTLGVAEDDLPKLQYRLARVRFLLGADPAQAAAALATSVEAADNPAEGYGLLAQAYLRLNPPDHAKALEATEQQVTRALRAHDTRLQTQARYRLGELYFQAQKVRDGRLALELIANDGSVPYFASRVLLAQSYEETQEWEQATQKWEQARQDSRLSPADRGRLLYRLGRCYAQERRLREAAGAWEEALALGGDEAQAAGLRLAELKLDAEAPPAAVEALAAGLSSVRGPDDYRNPLVPLIDARLLVQKAAELCRSKGAWDAAQKAAELYGRLAPPGGGDVMAGQTADEWARALRDQARQAPPEQAAALEEQSRVQLRAAGLAYEKAAGQVAAGPEQANWLANSASRLMLAKEYARAVAVLNRYVQLDGIVSDEQLGKAWFDLAQNQHYLRQYAAARAAYQRCLKPNGPFLVHARLRLAQIDLLEGHYDDAERALEENKKMLLEASQPDASLQEQTLFAFAEAAFQRQEAIPADKIEMRDYGTAAKRLEHALAQYPDGMWALRGRMMLARCYWQEAHIKGQLLQNARDGVVKLREEERLRYENQQSESLQKALEQYTKVEGPLRARWGAGDRLSAEEATYLKNASFWGADCYLYMKKFEEAARLYSILALRYQQLPEELLARYQISIIYVSYLSQLDKATEEVGRFRAAFDKVPESAYDGSTEAHVRSFWVQKLDEVTKGLKALKDAAKAPAPK